jgi:hypothetical protein
MSIIYRPAPVQSRIAICSDDASQIYFPRVIRTCCPNGLRGSLSQLNEPQSQKVGLAQFEREHLIFASLLMARRTMCQGIWC